MKHPMQKQCFTENKVKRFTENKLVTWLIDQLPNGMNDLSREFYRNNHDADDYDQILQQIGYSVSGIPYKNKDLHEITDADENPEESFERRYKWLKSSLAPIMSEVYQIAEEDME